jgi:hypothetical protein
MPSDLALSYSRWSAVVLIQSSGAVDLHRNVLGVVARFDGLVEHSSALMRAVVPHAAAGC